MIRLCDQIPTLQTTKTFHQLAICASSYRSRERCRFWGISQRPRSKPALPGAPISEVLSKGNSFYFEYMRIYPLQKNRLFELTNTES